MAALAYLCLQIVILQIALNYLMYTSIAFVIWTDRLDPGNLPPLVDRRDREKKIPVLFFWYILFMEEHEP